MIHISTDFYKIIYFGKLYENITIVQGLLFIDTK